jgi:cytochrome c551/c552
MNRTIVGLSLAAVSASTFAMVLHAAESATGLGIDFSAPATGSHAAWGSQVPFAITVSYAGKSSKFGEIPPNQVVARAAYAANAESASASAPLPDGVAEIGRSNCTGCHDFTANSAGPSFAAIARRGGPAATLAASIRNGSHGKWSGGSMPPHPEMTAAQASAIAQWILSQGNNPSIEYAIGKSGTFRMTAPGKPGPHAGMILSGYYTGPIKAGDSRTPSSGRSTVVIHGS